MRHFAVTPSEVLSAPFVVRMKLDDAELAERLPAGEAATFAEHVKACHGVWRVMLWMTAILN